MYSWEIHKILDEHNYTLPSSIYVEISDTRKSPQISFIGYDSGSNNHVIETKDGWSWMFKVYKD